MSYEGGNEDILHMCKRKRTMETFRYAKHMISCSDSDSRTTVLGRKLGIYTELRILDENFRQGPAVPHLWPL